MNFIRQIFEGKADNSMHYRFIRYGRGEYEKLFFSVSKSKSSFSAKASFDFVNDFVGIIAYNSKEDMAVSGKIIVPKDFQAEISSLGIEPKGYGKRGKLYTAEIEMTLKPEQLRALYEKFKQNAMLLNINSESFRLKSGSSIPKPGSALKPDFCSAKLPLSLLEEVVWDVKDFNTLEIKHILKIDEVVIPPELKDKPELARIEGKRKGKIIRILTVDGKEEKKEAALWV